MTPKQEVIYYWDYRNANFWKAFLIFLNSRLIYSRSQMQCGRVVEKCVQIFIKKRLKMYGVYFTAILKTPQKNQKQQNKYFIKFLRPLEIILLSDALKGIPLSSKWVQCAAVRTIHSLMIDPPQTCVQLAVCPLKQNEYSYILKNPGILLYRDFFLGYFILQHYGIWTRDILWHHYSYISI